MKTLASALLVLLSMLVAESSIAQQGINAPPDTIFYNGKIITVDSGFSIQQAFAVRGDQYVAVGTNAAVGVITGAALGDPNRLGLDGAFPALFLALLAPQLRNRRAVGSALLGGAIALVLVPFAPAGLPIIAAASAALIGLRR